MLNEADIGGLEEFLARHPAEESPQTFPDGCLLGEWRITGLLGRGGTSEVYRVEKNGAFAAAKVLTKLDDRSRRRFAAELRFLSENALPQFSRIISSGDLQDRPYAIVELLEPFEVPTDEKGVAAYLLAVCEAVDALHLAGFVHRDLKPKNIMRRAGGEVVLIDFGLAKDTLREAMPRSDVSIVDNKPVGVGTPDYAAPEQWLGGETSPAADIHALGRIANAAFGGKPPSCWNAIIRRATSSIPEQRYKTAGELAAAIRRRNAKKHLAVGFAGALLGVLAASVLLCREEIPVVRDVAGQMRFESFGETVMTNVVTRQLLYVKLETNSVGAVYPLEQAYRNVTNETAITLMRLNRGTNVFARPILLKPNHEYWVTGPGVLDASVTSRGTNTTIRLEKCVFINRSTVPLRKSGIRYAFRGGAYLNFINLDRPPNFSLRQFEGYDAALDAVRFRGPEDVRELNSPNISPPPSGYSFGE